MKKLTIELLAKKIAKDNAKFEKATPSGKIVIVAQDCLSRIHLGQIEPEAGTFCDIDYDFKTKTENFSFDSSIKEVLNTLPENTAICSACAKGSLLMSYLGRVNEFSFNDLSNSNDGGDTSHEKLLNLFSKEQLALIETFFEGSQHIYEDEFAFNMWDIDSYRLEVFNRPENIKMTDVDLDEDVKEYVYDLMDYSYDVSSKFLMIEVCDNLIKNKGTFIVPSSK